MGKGLRVREGFRNVGEMSKEMGQVQGTVFRKGVRAQKRGGC